MVTPFWGPFLKQFFCFGFCKPGLFFLPVGQLQSRQRVFWSTWMSVSLAMHVEGCRGTVLRSVRGAVRASLNTQRSRTTLLASVSTDVGFNAIIPQVSPCQQDPASDQIYEDFGSGNHGSIGNLAWRHCVEYCFLHVCLFASST